MRIFLSKCCGRSDTCRVYRSPTAAAKPTSAHAGAAAVLYWQIYRFPLEDGTGHKLLPVTRRPSPLLLLLAAQYTVPASSWYTFMKLWPKRLNQTMKKMTFLLFFMMMTTLFPKGSFFYNFRTFKIRILFQLFYMIKNEVSNGIYIYVY